MLHHYNRLGSGRRWSAWFWVRVGCHIRYLGLTVNAGALRLEQQWFMRVSMGEKGCGEGEMWGGAG